VNPTDDRERRRQPADVSAADVSAADLPGQPGRPAEALDAEEDTDGYLGADGRYYLLADDGRYYPEDGWEDPGPDRNSDGDPGEGAGAGRPPRAVARGALRGPAGPRRRHRHSARVVRRRRVAAGIAAVLAVAAVAVLGGVLWALHQINPGGRTGRLVTVVIPHGSSTGRIATILARAGVIHDATLFRYYVSLEGAGPLYAGTYRLATNEPYSRAVAALEQPPALAVERLVIPEGFTLRQIAARVAALPGLHITAASFLAVSSQGEVRSPFEPAGVDNLEGLVFPATYDISAGDTAAGIMQELVATFDQRAASIGLSPGLRSADHLDAYQVVTLASIVQAEAKYLDQYPDTASVLVNRLRLGMTLGADSTLVYALRQKNPGVDLGQVNYNQPNPYNTRIHPGLPPTPIDAPSLPALEAALHPPSTSLLYFVEVNPDGRLGFASSGAGFDQLIAQCNAAHLAC
jgi:UPF0755 protein